MKIKTTHYGECILKKQKYQNNGNLALSLVGQDGFPVATITTNIFAMEENTFCANIHNTMAFGGCICGVSFLCVLWMILVALSRELQGKEQFKNVVL